MAKLDLNRDGKVTMVEEILAAVGTYARAFLAAVTALFMYAEANNLNMDLGDLLLGGLAAIAPVILKALSPTNKEYGFKSKK